jgi:hypothetical protein
VTESRAANPAGRASAWRAAVRTVGILAMLSAALPSVVTRGGEVRGEAEREFLVRHSDAMPLRSDYTLGWPSSPLIRWFSETGLTTAPAGGVSVRRSRGFEFDLLSWSAASLAAGGLLVWLTRTKAG